MYTCQNVKLLEISCGGSFQIKMTGSSFTDEIRVKVPSFLKKITLFKTILNIPQKHYPFTFFLLFEDVTDCHDLR